LELKTLAKYSTAAFCTFTFVFAIAGIAAAQVVKPSTESVNKWYKADLHTHYTFHEPLERDIARYRETGYQFLVLSAKDTQNVIKYSKYSSPEMIVIEGVEQSFMSRKNQLGHVIAFPFKMPYPMTSGWTLKEGYAKLRAKNKNVVLGINHPHDGRWSIDDVLDADADGVHLFELNSIDMKHGEFETRLWDQALGRGAIMYATLTNDVHQFEDIDAYGYILIYSKSLTLDDMLDAIRAGSFYAVESGCGARLAVNEITGEGMERRYVVKAPGAEEIRIIGGGGTLSAVVGENAEYKIKGDEIYVRAEIADRNDRKLFTQPFIIK
jgi:hypothetical protein